jgi:hypothetical protein
MSRVYVDLFEKWSCWVADSTTPPQGWRRIIIRVGDDDNKTWHQAELTVPEAEAVARELMRMVQNARTAPTQTLDLMPERKRRKAAQRREAAE